MGLGRVGEAGASAERRLDSELAAVGSAMAMSAAEASASSGALIESSVASLRAETEASMSELVARLPEKAVDESVVSALRDELSGRVADASEAAAATSTRLSDVESDLADVVATSDASEVATNVAL